MDGGRGTGFGGKKRRWNFSPCTTDSSASSDSSSSDAESTTSQDVRILESKGSITIQPWGAWKNHWEDFSPVTFPTTSQLAETASKLKNEKEALKRKNKEEAASGESAVPGNSTYESTKNKSTNATSGSSSAGKTDGTETGRTQGASATHVNPSTFIKEIRQSASAGDKKPDMRRGSPAGSSQNAPVEESQGAKLPLKTSLWLKPQQTKFQQDKQHSLTPHENKSQLKERAPIQQAGSKEKPKKSNWTKAPEANVQVREPTAVKSQENNGQSKQPSEVTPPGDNEVPLKEPTSAKPAGIEDQPKEPDSAKRSVEKEAQSYDATSARPAARFIGEFHYTPYQNCIAHWPLNHPFRRYGASIYRNRFQLHNSFARRWNPANLTSNRIRPRVNLDGNFRNKWNDPLNELGNNVVLPNFGLGRAAHHLRQRKNLRNHFRHGVTNRRSTFYRISMDCLLITLIALFAMFCWWLGNRDHRNVGA